ncbi:MAG TPA: HtaA domain-containing protein [Solirubrobacterales bacterium]|nr:HtaA domain-containing protein [Solirubrobacterales bacterium]
MKTPCLASTARVRRASLLFALFLVATLSATLLAASPRAAAAPQQISAGVLKWGIKGSWRGYAGGGVQSGGVVQNAEGIYEFPITGGSYDPETKTTTVEAEGTIHWRGHYYPSESAFITPPAGYDGPLDIYVLDITISDPVVTISAAGSQVSVEAISRNVHTWQLVDLGRTDLAVLDPTAATPAIDSGTTAWSGIPAALSQSGAEDVFGGNYVVGQALDLLAFSYAGEGGAPDFAEHWTDPDSNGLELAGNGTFGEQSSVGATWVDQARHIIQTSVKQPSGDYSLRAFDLDRGEFVGEPTDLSLSEAAYLGNGLINPVKDIAYFGSSGGELDTYLRWDPDTGTYSRGSITPVQIPGGGLFDAANDSWLRIARVVPEGADPADYDSHRWYLYAVRETGLGEFAQTRYELPNAPTGWNRNWYGSAGAGAVAADGSIVLPRATTPTAQAGVTPAPLSEVGAQRIVLDEETGTATVSEVPGTMTTIGDTGVRPYSKAMADAAGDVTFLYSGTAAIPSRLRQFRLDYGGVLVPAGPEAQLTQTKNPVFTLGADGTAWQLDFKAQRLTGVREGRVVFSKTYPFVNTVQSAIGALPDGGLWLQSNDGTSTGGLTSTYGWAHFADTGHSPTITVQPAGRSVTIEPDGVAEVSFDAAATGTPPPTLQWQRRAPGSARFADIAGETGGTLTVGARAAEDGAAFRAVATNGAGALATDVATLEVRHRPAITFDLADRTATEGEDVAFSLLASAVPEAETTWQRRVGGFWQAIDLDSGDFEATATKLTIKDVNGEMDGALFRAKLTNAVGTTYSRAAKLTVAGPVGEAVTFGSGSFEWGFANRWRCYVVGTVAQGGIELAGGVERVPGTTATGSLCPAAGAGSEALRFPVAGGRYDPADGTLEVDLEGSVRFWGHVSGGVPALDTTFSDLHLEASGATGTLYADAVGPTLADPTVRRREDIALVTVDLAGAGPIADGTDGLTWSGAKSALTAAGAEVFGAYPEGEPFDPIAMDLRFGTPREAPPGTGGPGGSDDAPQGLPAGPAADQPPALPATLTDAKAKGPAARVRQARGVQALGAGRVAALGAVACPGTVPCRLVAPRRVAVRIDGHRYVVAVLAARWIKAGATGTLRARLPRAAVRDLAGGRTRIAVPVKVFAAGTETKRTLRVTLRGGG